MNEANPIGELVNKALMGIEIRDATTYELMTHKQMVLRFFGYIISGIPLTLGFMWMGFNKKRRCWHDFMAHTIVVKKEKKPKEEAPSPLPAENLPPAP